jgi:RNA polymerase sigma factor (sigma-70 family)
MKTEDEQARSLLPLVKRLAASFIRHLPPSISVEDLEGEGAACLVSLIRRYDPTKGASLMTFAQPRILGAMHDYLRKIDPLPRAIRSFSKDIEKAIIELESEGGEITDQSISKKLGVDHIQLSELRSLILGDHSRGDPLFLSDVTAELQSECIQGTREELIDLQSLKTEEFSEFFRIPAADQVLLALRASQEAGVTSLRNFYGITGEGVRVRENNLYKRMLRILLSLKNASSS